MNKSLFRRPGTKHFQLVHRSQRDPLINDPDAPDRVFATIDRSQKRTGAIASSSTTTTDEAEESEKHEDAASYGIFFDNDDDYDYLQHLRSVGQASDAYLVEAPTKANKGKGKGKERSTGFDLKEEEPYRKSGVTLPEDVLPSHPLDERTYDEVTGEAAVTAGGQGLQPDMDPRLREVLEALDDDAYAVDDGAGSDGEDDFWGEVVKGGEIYEAEDVPDWDEAEPIGEKKEGEWDAVFAAARARAEAAASEDEDDEEVDTEGGDTIAELRASSAKRPPRKAATDRGSSFSMSSSAMFRNEGLRDLDDKFDQIEKMYDEESDDSWGGESDEDDDDLASHAATQPPRADLDKIMDDFLARFEVLGGKFRPVLEPTPGMENDASMGKLDRIRRELAKLDIGEEEAGEDAETTARRKEKERILRLVNRQEEEELKRGPAKEDIELPEDIDKEKWDVETVLSTYSNLSNHPRMLRIRDEKGSRKPARIRIDERTGFPLVDGADVTSGRRRGRKIDPVPEEEDVEMSEEEGVQRETITRPRAESPGAKKARKAAVKAERSARRSEKRETKEAFGNETKRQKRMAGKQLANHAADVRVGDGVRRLA